MGDVVRCAGLWELGWNTPIKEIELWEYPLRDFGVELLCMAPVTGIQAAVREYADMPAILAAHPDFTHVYVDEAGTTPLAELEHPPIALYVFGKASLSPLRAYGSPSTLSVRIPTRANKGLLWPHQAAALVLYDRLSKSWR